MRNYLNSLLIITVLTVITLAMIKTPQNQQREEIKIGALLCLTGPCAETGNASLKGLQLALEEINSQKQLPLKIGLDIQDSGEAKVTQAIAGYQALRQKRINLIIGPTWTPAGLAIAPIAAKDENVLMISPSLGVAEFNEQGTNLFNLWPHDRIATKKLAEYSIKRGWGRVAILSAQQSWVKTQGDIFAKTIKKLGGAVTCKLEPLPEDKSLNTEINTIIRQNPDAVFFSHYEAMGLASKKLRASGFKGQFIATLMDQTRIKDSQGALEGAVFAEYPETIRSFRENFEARFNETPSVSADNAYDALKLIAGALEKSEKIEDIKSSIAAVKKVKGASGSITFDDQGGVVREPVIWEIKDGAFVRS